MLTGFAQNYRPKRWGYAKPQFIQGIEQRANLRDSTCALL
jgi:hypothetical protein